MWRVRLVWSILVGRYGPFRAAVGLVATALLVALLLVIMVFAKTVQGAP